MTRMLKIDMHTHPIEALKEKMGLKGILSLNKEVAYAVVKAIKSAGLNGIAITEHDNFNHSWVVSLEIAERFGNENLIILPGVEIDYRGQQFLQIYIPYRYRKRLPFFRGKEWFLILAHPGYYNPLEIQDVMSMHFDAVEGTSIHGDFSWASRIALAKNIPVTISSDAHSLEDIGLKYTDLELK